MLGFDPAHGVGQEYSVIICLAQDPEGYIHFVNMWRRNDFKPDRQADMVIEWSKRYGAPVAAEDVGFQQLYESLIQQKGSVIDYRKSKASNRTLKQGLMNRLRTWFERELVCFPFGDDETRRLVNILLEELETHAWRDGMIVDLGNHNDCVMALGLAAWGCKTMPFHSSSLLPNQYREKPAPYQIYVPPGVRGRKERGLPGLSL